MYLVSQEGKWNERSDQGGYVLLNLSRSLIRNDRTQSCQEPSLGDIFCHNCLMQKGQEKVDAGLPVCLRGPCGDTFLTFLFISFFRSALVRIKVGYRRKIKENGFDEKKRNKEEKESTSCINCKVKMKIVKTDKGKRIRK